MTGHLHLYRRDSRYWWRRRLPARIALILGRSHATCALRTADPHLARIRCRRLTSLFDRYFSVVLWAIPPQSLPQARLSAQKSRRVSSNLGCWISSDIVEQSVSTLSSVSERSRKPSCGESRILPGRAQFPAAKSTNAMLKDVVESNTTC